MRALWFGCAALFLIPSAAISQQVSRTRTRTEATPKAGAAQDDRTTDIVVSAEREKYLRDLQDAGGFPYNMKDRWRGSSRKSVRWSWVWSKVSQQPSRSVLGYNRQGWREAGTQRLPTEPHHHYR